MALVNNREDHRYELTVDDHTAFAEYRLDTPIIVFTHTVVPEALRGQGIGSKLIEAALKDVRKRDLKVVPLCTFVRRYINEHPEMEDLLAD